MIWVSACVAAIAGAAFLWPIYSPRMAAERELVASVADYRTRAAQGDAEAEYNLGLAYVQGKGVRKDNAEAARWIRKAADQGYAKAESRLASMYYYGRGVPQNYTESMLWARKAADQGDATAEYTLGIGYTRGRGVPHDDAEAVRWYRKAADQGYAWAESALGYNYSRGLGTPPDDAEAVRWYRRAAEHGYAHADYLVGTWYARGDPVAQDYAEAARWLRKGADQGDEGSQLLLGTMYLLGRGVPQSYLKAVRWLVPGLGNTEIARFRTAPLRGWTVLATLVLCLPLFLPQRLFGRSKWVLLALTSAACAAMLAHEVLSYGWTGPLHKFFIVFSAVVSAVFAAGAVMAAREQKQRPSPPQSGGTNEAQPQNSVG
jgi:TPR repeat protein